MFCSLQGSACLVYGGHCKYKESTRVRIVWSRGGWGMVVVVVVVVVVMKQEDGGEH
jgi:hypothetical protein